MEPVTVGHRSHAGRVPPMAPTRQTLEALELLQWPGIGPAKVRRLLRSVADDEPLIERATEVFGVPEPDRRKAADTAARIMDECGRLGIHLFGMQDEQYPTLLKTIEDPPPVLYARGNIDALTTTGVAVVGTRRASAAGLKIAGMIAQALVQCGITVVSGLAFGIDAAAHQGALDSQGRTIAILAHGLHTIRPRANESIGLALLERGALISEHPPGVEARRAEFVQRNRMQSGMSICSIIVESGVKGGAIHQANFTRKQGRPLLTVLRASGASGLNESGARHLISTLGATVISTTGELGRQIARIRRSTPRVQESLL